MGEPSLIWQRDTAPSPGAPGTPEAGRSEAGTPPEPPEGAQPDSTSISDLWPPDSERWNGPLEAPSLCSPV